MNKILLSVLLILSFKICLADQLAYVTLSQSKEAQEYVSRDLDLAYLQSLENGSFKSVGKIINYKCDPFKGSFQLENDSTINEEQENKQTTKFIITDANTNGIDTTPVILEAKAFIVFYTVENDNLLYMSHVWPKQNSQSYGPMYSLTSETKLETYEEYKADVFNFDWLYITGYGDKKGAAKVQLIKVYKPQGITYLLKISSPNSEVIIYKGYLEGSLNFSEFE